MKVETNLMAATDFLNVVKTTAWFSTARAPKTDCSHFLFGSPFHGGFQAG
jgi:hypothetical protein